MTLGLYFQIVKKPLGQFFTELIGIWLSLRIQLIRRKASPLVFFYYLHVLSILSEFYAQW